ncbi:hypothetical protein ASG92_25600 [Arthrobacter sp. Soil736]|nr:hypothetical protein ASG92_25600 [Arthrobacter sp. Soil736]
MAHLVTRLSPFSARKALDQLRQLQGPRAGHPPTRTELFYCSVCFDVSDGILTMESRAVEEISARL